MDFIDYTLTDADRLHGVVAALAIVFPCLALIWRDDRRR